MPLGSILKLIGLQHIPAEKRNSRAKRHERRTEEWEYIGSTSSYDMNESRDLDQVPEWLKKEWYRVRGTSRTLGGNGESPKA